jgi:predicted kinase
MEVSAAAIIKAFDSVNRGNGQLIMMVGLPASGKSTISDALVAAGWVRLNKDTLRKELYGDEAIQGDVKEVNRLYYQRLEEALVARKRIVVDNINLNYFFRKGTIERARLEGYRDISNVVLKVPVEECIRRNAGRERKVPDEVKNVFGRYTAISAIQDRAKLGIDINEILKKSVVGPVVVDSVQVEDVTFSDAYEQSIEKRMMAEVEIQTKRQNLETERINAEITVTQAKAQADSALAQAQAEAEAIRVRGVAEGDAIKSRGEALKQNAQLIALTQAEKWNGVLPTTMVPGGTVPFLNLKANTGTE